MAVVAHRFLAPGILCLLASWALPYSLAGQVQPDEEPPYPTPEQVAAAGNAPLFNSHETLRVTLSADFNALRTKDRSGSGSDERPGSLEWVGADGRTEVREIQIRTRGNFRLSRRNCDIPPFRLNLKPEGSEGTIFQGQDKLKMVVPCKLGQDYWVQYVIAEYLTYRMLNILTPLSFRARFVEATFVDESGEDDPFVRYAFLLEDDSEMAKRNDGIKEDREDWEAAPIHPMLLEKNYAILVELFQYMIGNTDWSGVQMHNVQLFRDRAGLPYPVPFDFDFSGLVNARYATPDPRLPIKDVRQRYFRGFCPDQMSRLPGQYQEVYDLFFEKREEIHELWRTQEGLEPDRMEDALEYLDDFYEILENPDRLQRNISRQCHRLWG